MNHIARQNLQLFGRKTAPRKAQPHDAWTKEQLWARAQELEGKLTGARRALTVLRNAEPDHFKACEISESLAKCEFSESRLGVR